MALQIANDVSQRRVAARRLERRCLRLTQLQARLLTRVCIALRRFCDIQGPARRGYSSRRDYAVECLQVSGSTATDWYRVGVALENCTPLRFRWEEGRLSYSALLALSRYVPVADIPDWLEPASRMTCSALQVEIARWQTRANSDQKSGPKGSVAPLHDEEASENVRLETSSDTHELFREALDVYSALDGGGAPPSVLFQWILAEAGTELDATCESAEEARRRLGMKPRDSSSTRGDDEEKRSGNEALSPRTVPLASMRPDPSQTLEDRSHELEAAHLDAHLRALQNRRRPLQAHLDLTLYRFSQKGLAPLLGHANLESWATTALDLEPRTLYRHLRRARTFLRCDDLRNAFEGSRIGTIGVLLLSKLEKYGVPESALAPWIEAASRTTVQNLEHKVRWAAQTYRQDFRRWALEGWPPPTDADLTKNTRSLKQVLESVPTEEPVRWEVPDKLWPLELQLEPDTVDFLAVTLVSIQDTWSKRLAPDDPGSTRPPLWACFREILASALRAQRPLLANHRGNLDTRVRDRDHWMCMVPGCTRRAMMENHHIHFRSRGGPDTEENLVVLCLHHHKMLHANRIAIRGQATKETAQTLRWRLGTRVDGVANDYFRGNERVPVHEEV